MVSKPAAPCPPAPPESILGSLVVNLLALLSSTANSPLQRISSKARFQRRSRGILLRCQEQTKMQPRSKYLAATLNLDAQKSGTASCKRACEEKHRRLHVFPASSCSGQCQGPRVTKVRILCDTVVLFFLPGQNRGFFMVKPVPIFCYQDVVARRAAGPRRAS